MAGPAAPGSRVLVVPALFEEANRTRRLLAETMRALAAAGVGSVLSDLPGCHESLAPLARQDLAGWRDAIRLAARTFAASHVLTLRGGALLAPDDLPGWRFEPLGGASALRQLLRAGAIAGREGGGAATLDGLLGEARERGIELAGYRLGAALVRDLERATLLDAAGQCPLTLGEIGGSALWLRSEPGEDAAQAAALAARIAADIAR